MVALFSAPPSLNRWEIAVFLIIRAFTLLNLFSDLAAIRPISLLGLFYFFLTSATIGTPHAAETVVNTVSPMG